MFASSSALHLDAQMVDAARPAARRDREIHARIVEHPLGVVGMADRRIGAEQGGGVNRSERTVQIVSGGVNVQALPWGLFGGGAQTDGAPEPIRRSSFR